MFTDMTMTKILRSKNTVQQSVLEVKEWILTIGADASVSSAGSSVKRSAVISWTV